MRLFSTVKTFALDILFPLSCAGCGDEGTHLCVPCAAAIPVFAPTCIVCKKLVPANNAIPPGRTCKLCRKKSRIYASFSPYSYDHPAIRSLIHDLKYRRMRGAAPVLGDLLITALAFYGAAPPHNTLFIPIPLYPSRERARGFNQARLLADHISKELDMETRSDIVKKIKKVPSLMDLRTLYT